MLKNVVSGALWLGIGQWSARILGIFSLFILAHYLTPKDYGIVALINITVIFLESILLLGIGRYIVSKKDLTLDDTHCAWTMTVIKTAFLALILFLLAPFIADFYQTPEIKLPTQLLAVILLISGFVNVTPHLLKKELKFNRVALYLVVPKLIGTVASVTCAIIFQSYWALVIGTMVLRLNNLLLSYMIHPFRPRFSLKNYHEIWLFSKLTLLSNIAAFIKSRLDMIIIGKYYGNEQLGTYSMSSTVAVIPSKEISAPFVDSIIPSLARHRNQPNNNYIEQITNGLRIISLIIWPCSFGLLTIAPEFVALALSDQWLQILSFLPLMTIIISFDALATYCKQILLLENLLSFSVKWEWWLVGYYGLTFALALYYSSIIMMLYFKLAGSVIFVLALFYRMWDQLRFNFIRASLLIIQPLVIALAIYLFIVNSVVFSTDDSLWLILFYKSLLWLLIYPLGIVSSWAVSGKKACVESILFDKLRHKLFKPVSRQLVQTSQSQSMIDQLTKLISAKAACYFNLASVEQIYVGVHPNSSTNPIYEAKIQSHNETFELIIKFPPRYPGYDEGYHEFENLKRSYAHFCTLDFGLHVPEPLDYWADIGALVCRKSDGVSLKAELFNNNSWPAAQDKQQHLLILMAKCGQWLREFHQLGQRQIERFGDQSLTRVFITSSQRSITAITASPHLDQQLKALLKITSDSNFSDYCQHNQTLIHDDFGPSNILACGQQLSVLDMASKVSVSADYDIGWFIATMDTINPYPANPYYHRRAVKKLKQAFVASYFEGGAIPEHRLKAINYFYRYGLASILTLQLNKILTFKSVLLKKVALYYLNRRYKRLFNKATPP